MSSTAPASPQQDDFNFDNVDVYESLLENTLGAEARLDACDASNFTALRSIEKQLDDAFSTPASGDALAPPNFTPDNANLARRVSMRLSVRELALVPGGRESDWGGIGKLSSSPVEKSPRQQGSPKSPDAAGAITLSGSTTTTTMTQRRFRAVLEGGGDGNAAKRLRAVAAMLTKQKNQKQQTAPSLNAAGVEEGGGPLVTPRTPGSAAGGKSVVTDTTRFVDFVLTRLYAHEAASPEAASSLNRGVSTPSVLSPIGSFTDATVQKLVPVLASYCNENPTAVEHALKQRPQFIEDLLQLLSPRVNEGDSGKTASQDEGASSISERAEIRISNAVGHLCVLAAREVPSAFHGGTIPLLVILDEGGNRTMSAIPEEVSVSGGTSTKDSALVVNNSAAVVETPHRAPLTRIEWIPTLVSMLCLQRPEIFLGKEALAHAQHLAQGILDACSDAPRVTTSAPRAPDPSAKLPAFAMLLAAISSAFLSLSDPDSPAHNVAQTSVLPLETILTLSTRILSTVVVAPLWVGRKCEGDMRVMLRAVRGPSTDSSDVVLASVERLFSTDGSQLPTETRDEGASDTMQLTLLVSCGSSIASSIATCIQNMDEACTEEIQQRENVVQHAPSMEGSIHVLLALWLCEAAATPADPLDQSTATTEPQAGALHRQHARYSEIAAGLRVALSAMWSSSVLTSSYVHLLSEGETTAAAAASSAPPPVSHGAILVALLVRLLKHFGAQQSAHVSGVPPGELIPPPLGPLSHGPTSASDPLGNADSLLVALQRVVPVSLGYSQFLSKMVDAKQALQLLLFSAPIHRCDPANSSDAMVLSRAITLLGSLWSASDKRSSEAGTVELTPNYRDILGIISWMHRAHQDGAALERGALWRINERIVSVLVTATTHLKQPLTHVDTAHLLDEFAPCSAIAVLTRAAYLWVAADETVVDSISSLTVSVNSVAVFLDFLRRVVSGASRTNPKLWDNVRFEPLLAVLNRVDDAPSRASVLATLRSLSEVPTISIAQQDVAQLCQLLVCSTTSAEEFRAVCGVLARHRYRGLPDEALSAFSSSLAAFSSACLVLHREILACDHPVVDWVADGLHHALRQLDANREAEFLRCLRTLILPALLSTAPADLQAICAAVLPLITNVVGSDTTLLQDAVEATNDDAAMWSSFVQTCEAAVDAAGTAASGEDCVAAIATLRRVEAIWKRQRAAPRDSATTTAGAGVRSSADLASKPSPGPAPLDSPPSPPPESYARTNSATEASSTAGPFSWVGNNDGGLLLLSKVTALDDNEGNGHGVLRSTSPLGHQQQQPSAEGSPRSGSGAGDDLFSLDKSSRARRRSLQSKGITSSTAKQQLTEDVEGLSKLLSLKRFQLSEVTSALRVEEKKLEQVRAELRQESCFLDHVRDALAAVDPDHFFTVEELKRFNRHVGTKSISVVEQLFDPQCEHPPPNAYEAVAAALAAKRAMDVLTDRFHRLMALSVDTNNHVKLREAASTLVVERQLFEKEKIFYATELDLSASLIWKKHAKIFELQHQVDALARDSEMYQKLKVDHRNLERHARELKAMLDQRDVAMCAAVGRDDLGRSALSSSAMRSARSLRAPGDDSSTYHKGSNAPARKGEQQMTLRPPPSGRAATDDYDDDSFEIDDVPADGVQNSAESPAKSSRGRTRPTSAAPHRREAAGSSHLANDQSSPVQQQQQQSRSLCRPSSAVIPSSAASTVTIGDFVDKEKRQLEFGLRTAQVRIQRLQQEINRLKPERNAAIMEAVDARQRTKFVELMHKGDLHGLAWAEQRMKRLEREKEALLADAQQSRDNAKLTREERDRAIAEMEAQVKKSEAERVQVITTLALELDTARLRITELSGDNRRKDMVISQLTNKLDLLKGGGGGGGGGAQRHVQHNSSVGASAFLASPSHSAPRAHSAAANASTATTRGGAPTSNNADPGGDENWIDPKLRNFFAWKEMQRHRRMKQR